MKIVGASLTAVLSNTEIYEVIERVEVSETTVESITLICGAETVIAGVSETALESPRLI